MRFIIIKALQLVIIPSDISHLNFLTTEEAVFLISAEKQITFFFPKEITFPVCIRDSMKMFGGAFLSCHGHYSIYG